MSVAQVIEPKIYRWTRDEYYRLAEQGWFQDRLVELIDGEIIEMPPPGNAHCVGVECVASELRTVFGANHWVRVQMPLNLGTHSDPQPDIAVVRGTPRDYADHPTTALLVVEVSDTSLRYDRGRKASLYAKAGLAEYWIVDVANSQLEIYRQPKADQQQAFGFGYADKTILTSSDVARPLAAAQAQIKVADLLP